MAAIRIFDQNVSSVKWVPPLKMLLCNNGSRFFKVLFFNQKRKEWATFSVF